MNHQLMHILLPWALGREDFRVLEGKIGIPPFPSVRTLEESPPRDAWNEH
jgi:hypothetical protein